MVLPGGALADRRPEVGDNKHVLIRRIKVTALFLFLFGLPLFGTVGTYLHAHSTMRSSAITFVNNELPEILAKRDFDELYFLGTLTLKGELKEPEFTKSMEGLGEFQALEDVRATRSTVGERSDQAWQFVDISAKARFSTRNAEVHVRAARRSTVLPEWRIEEFELVSVE